VGRSFDASTRAFRKRQGVRAYLLGVIALDPVAVAFALLVVIVFELHRLRRRRR
jgi:hypothetical protein